MFLPVYISKPVTTKELETFISCHCRGSCSKNIYYYSLNSVKTCQNLEAVEGQDMIASDDDDE